MFSNPKLNHFPSHYLLTYRWKRGWLCAIWWLKLEGKMVLYLLIVLRSSTLRLVWIHTEGIFVLLLSYIITFCSLLFLNHESFWISLLPFVCRVRHLCHTNQFTVMGKRGSSDSSLRIFILFLNLFIIQCYFRW